MWRVKKNVNNECQALWKNIDSWIMRMSGGFFSNFLFREIKWSQQQSKVNSRWNTQFFVFNFYFTIHDFVNFDWFIDEHFWRLFWLIFFVLHHVYCQLLPFVLNWLLFSFYLFFVFAHENENQIYVSLFIFFVFGICESF